MQPSLRRGLLTAAAVLVFLVLVGATYQGVATALERRQFPHPGQLVDVGGHQLHIYCTGEGSPTVVLEAPAAGISPAWGWVQPAIAQTTRVCSYDRSGLGWSEAGDRPYEPSAVPEQLHALLDRSGERGPYVMVGQGLGAVFATMYAARFGDGVSALVLIDPPSETAGSPQSSQITRLINLSPWLARTGVLRATRLLSENAMGLPEPAAGALSAFLNRPDHLTRAARELSRWDETVALAAAAPLAMRVVRVNAAGGERLAFLTDSRQAETAIVVIRDAVAAVDDNL